MRLSKRVRALAWEGLGWSAAAGLAIALAVTVALGIASERGLRQELAAERARNAGAAKSLAVCQATTATLENALSVVERRDGAGAATPPLSTADLLARKAAGEDACARAFEAERLVREAAR